MALACVHWENKCLFLKLDKLNAHTGNYLQCNANINNRYDDYLISSSVCFWCSWSIFIIICMWFYVHNSKTGEGAEKRFPFFFWFLFWFSDRYNIRWISLKIAARWLFTWKCESVFINSKLVLICYAENWQLFFGKGFMSNENQFFMRSICDHTNNADTSPTSPKWSWNA